MSSALQTVTVFVIVAFAAVWLFRLWFGKKKSPGCGGACGAVSPEVKRLQSQLKRSRRA